MNTTAVIYARVSSTGDRQNNERQIEDLIILGERKKYTIQKIYEEKISGAKKNTERSETGVIEGHFATVEEVLEWLDKDVGF